MTKDALNPVFSGITPPAPDAAASAGGWSCACGRTNITSNFCPDCGAKKPAPDAGWDCACGQTNIKSNFCPNCGKKRGE